ncbi:MAG: DUF167 domain-containing protein [bacterium]|nr:DUF167 domain-containing protein [bacterium]
MRVFVKAKPRSKEGRIEKIDDTHFVVFVKELPVQGKANAAIGKALAEYFGIPVSSVKLTSGFSSKEKTFSLDPSP